MPSWKFTAPNGKVVKVTGDTLPSESELDDIFKAAGVSTDVGSSTTVPEAPSVAQLASAKTPAERIAALKDTPVGGDLQKVLSLARLWATNGPHAVVQGIKDFMGGDYAKGAHEAISGAGITALPMVAGPAVMAAAGAPVTAAATLAGGYAGGKLAPMAADALGATPDQAALAGDVGMVAGGAAGGRLLQMPIPSGQQAAQAALKALRFARHPVRETAKTVADAILARTETPSGPVSTAGYPRAGTTPAPPTGEPPAHLDLSQRVPAGGLTKEQIGERLAAAQKQGMTAPAYESPQNPATPVREPLPPRAAAPVPEGPPEPSMAKPAAPSKSPQQILNEEAIAKRRAAYQESLKADAKPVLEDVEAGKMTAEQAAAELAKRWGTPSDAERRFPPNKSGLPSNPPTARKARGKVSDLADMPSTAPVEAQTQSDAVRAYHGTRSASQMDSIRASTGGEFGPGIYLTKDPGTAEFFATHVARGPDGPSIVPVDVTLKNPFRVSKTDWIKMTERSTPSTVQKRLMAKGYDGIIGTGLTGQEQIVAFDPKQVNFALSNTR